MTQDSLTERIFEQVNTPIRQCLKYIVVKRSRKKHILNKVKQWLIEKQSYKEIKMFEFYNLMDLKHLPTDIRNKL